MHLQFHSRSAGSLETTARMSGCDRCFVREVGKLKKVGAMQQSAIFLSQRAVMEKRSRVPVLIS